MPSSVVDPFTGLQVFKCDASKMLCRKAFIFRKKAFFTPALAFLYFFKQIISSKNNKSEEAAKQKEDTLIEELVSLCVTGKEAIARSYLDYYGLLLDYTAQGACGTKVKLIWGDECFFTPEEWLAANPPKEPAEEGKKEKKEKKEPAECYIYIIKADGDIQCHPVSKGESVEEYMPAGAVFSGAIPESYKNKDFEVLVFIDPDFTGQKVENTTFFNYFDVKKEMEEDFEEGETAIVLSKHEITRLPTKEKLEAQRMDEVEFQMEVAEKKEEVALKKKRAPKLSEEEKAAKLKAREEEKAAKLKAKEEEKAKKAEERQKEKEERQKLKEAKKKDEKSSPSNKRSRKEVEQEAVPEQPISELREVPVEEPKAKKPRAPRAKKASKAE